MDTNWWGALCAKVKGTSTGPQIRTYSKQLTDETNSNSKWRTSFSHPALVSGWFFIYMSNSKELRNSRELLYTGWGGERERTSPKKIYKQYRVKSSSEKAQIIHNINFKPAVIKDNWD